MNRAAPLAHPVLRRATVGVAPVLAAVVAGCSAVAGAAGTGTSSPVSAPAESTAVSAPSATAPPSGRLAATAETMVAPGVEGVRGPPATALAVPAGQRPVRVVIGRIGVNSSLVDLGVAADGTIEVPTDFQRAGWLDVGPAPGQVGPAVIAGHVDSKIGPAVFYRLRELRVGDAIAVVRADGSRVGFTVDNVEQYAKAQFPTDAVYGPVPGPVLRLITCGGSFDRRSGHYRDNVVVYAS